ncbi:MAG: NHL repeat-containing protein [Lachnospiraceae bacterium]|nr:NHL repeat-containing protein [Lachnospiraceae bacterium]
MSEEVQSKERIEDWVAKEGKARGSAPKGGGRGGKRKLWIILAIVAVVVIAAVILILYFFGKGKIKTSGQPIGKDVMYLNGLDVMCGPNGIAPMEDGSFLVTDVFGKKIWKADDKGAEVYAGATTEKDASGEPLGGYKDGTLEESLFKEPWAIVPFLDGFAVSDTENNAVRLVRGKTVETINGSSDVLKMGDMGVIFDQPTGLAADNAGRLYVADTARGTIYVITQQGRVEVFEEGFNRPMGLCWADGTLYVAETGENRILQIKDGTKIVLAGTGEEGNADGLATVATFAAPQGVTVGDDGVVYVSDTVNGTVRRIKDGKVDMILQYEGKDLTTYPTMPVGMCYKNGALYVCDVFSRRVYVLEQK